MDIAESAGLMLVGLMLSGFGCAFAVNLFGIADDLACATLRRSVRLRRFCRGLILAGSAALLAGAAGLLLALK